MSATRNAFFFGKDLNPSSSYTGNITTLTTYISDRPDNYGKNKYSLTVIYGEHYVPHVVAILCLFHWY
jgi:hypothetical protein